MTTITSSYNFQDSSYNVFKLVAWKDWAKYIADNGQFEAYVAMHNWAQMIISAYAASKEWDKLFSMLYDII